MALKITRKVGKNAHGQSASDVKIIQMALAAIKNKKYKPCYAGKIDGKAGPKTLQAICDFQTENKIKVTGVVETHGPTMNCLNRRLPHGVKGSLSKASAGGSAASLTDGASGTNAAQKIKQQEAKIRQQNEKLAKEIMAHAPIPKTFIKGLADFVKKATEHYIAVGMADLILEKNGKIIAKIFIENSSSDPQEKLKQQQILSKISQTIPRWSYNQATGLQSDQWNNPAAKKAKKPSSSTLKLLGLQGHKFHYTITQSLLGGLEQHTDDMIDQEKSDPKVEKEIFELLSKDCDKVSRQLNEARASGFDLAIAGIQGAAATIATELAVADQVRKFYQRNVDEAISKIKEDVKSGKLPIFQAEKEAHELRGKIMKKARKYATPVVEQLSEKLKKDNIPLHQLHEKYLASEFDGKRLEDLTLKEREQLAQLIIDKAGSPNIKVNVIAKIGGIFSKGIAVASILVAGYAIWQAEDPMHEAMKQAAILGISTLTGIGAGFIAVMLFAVSSPLVLAAIVIITSISAATFVELTFDDLFPASD